MNSLRFFVTAPSGQIFCKAKIDPLLFSRAKGAPRGWFTQMNPQSFDSRSKYERKYSA